MSVRAYRIKKINIAKNCSFNLWNDGNLIDFFKKNGQCIEYSNEDGVRFMELEISCLEKAIKDFPFEEEDYKLEIIKADIDSAKKTEDDFILYECY